MCSSSLLGTTMTLCAACFASLPLTGRHLLLCFPGLDCEITFSGVKLWKSFPIPLILASTKATVMLISCLAVFGPLEQCKIGLQISVRTDLCVVHFQRDEFCFFFTSKVQAKGGHHLCLVPCQFLLICFLQRADSIVQA